MTVLQRLIPYQILLVFLISCIYLAFGTPAEAGDGLVTCDGPECNFCNLVELFNLVIQWLTIISTLLVVMVLAYAGFKLVTSQGDQSAYEKGKQYLYNGIIGIIIILAAFTIIDTLLKALLKDTDNIGKIWEPAGEDCGYQTIPVGTEIQGITQTTRPNGDQVASCDPTTNPDGCETFLNNCPGIGGTTSITSPGVGGVWLCTVPAPAVVETTTAYRQGVAYQCTDANCTEQEAGCAAAGLGATRISGTDSVLCTAPVANPSAETGSFQQDCSGQNLNACIIQAANECRDRGGILSSGGGNVRNCTVNGVAPSATDSQAGGEDGSTAPGADQAPDTASPNDTVPAEDADATTGEAGGDGNTDGTSASAATPGESDTAPEEEGGIIDSISDFFFGEDEDTETEEQSAETDTSGSGEVAPGSFPGVEETIEAPPA